MSGFFGAVSHKDVVLDIFFGTDYHSHLGTKRAGMTLFDQDTGYHRVIHSLESGYFRTKFEPDLHRFKGNAGIGIISDNDSQPILINSHLGKFALATVGKINNIEQLTKRSLSRGSQFVETSQGCTNPTELISKLICEEADFVSGIENVHRLVDGSCSMLILSGDTILAARDKLGRTPVVISKSPNGFGVALESCSFSNIGYQTMSFPGPGEVVKLTADGIETIKPAYEKMQICAFLWVYYGYPPSEYEQINVDDSRYRCGAALARKDQVEADFVCGIPDSGVGHAIGYSNERKLPYKRAYTKYTPTWPRSFLPQDQSTRELVAQMKLIPNETLVKGKRMVFLDDSIVRGTQLKDNAYALKQCGADKVHMRIACPPLTFPCPFLNFSQSRSTMELATRKAIHKLEGNENHMDEYCNPTSDRYHAMVDQIAKDLKLDSLLFQDMPDLIEAIGLPAERLCTYCWNASGRF